MEKTNETFWSISKKMFDKGGIKTFYKGLTPTLLRAFVVNSVIFFVFEEMIKFSHRLGEQD